MQLNSLASQTHSDIALYVADDGSTDASLSVVQRMVLDADRRCFDGPQSGFCRNFLVALARTETSHLYYAFCDQDDLWFPDKLKRATGRISAVPRHVPALYCSRTELIDATGAVMGQSPLFPHPPSFPNALVQNIGGGNTMVMNRAARDLVVATASIEGVVSHDWWTYLVVTGAGGVVIYDTEPGLAYRQHGSNVVGANRTWMARWRRVQALWQGRFKDWNAAHFQALTACQHLLTEDNQRVLASFRKACLANSRRERLYWLRVSGVYRQTPMDQLGLYAAALLKRL